MRGRIDISMSWTVPTQQQCMRCPPVRDVGLRLDVNDPRMVAEVGRDVDRRGHDDRRLDGRGGLGGRGEAEVADGSIREPRMAAVSPLATTAANPNLFIVVPSSFCLLWCVRAVARSRGSDAVSAIFLTLLTDLRG